MAGPTTKPAAGAALIAALPAPAALTSDGWANGGATIELANAEFCALTGYTAAELKGKNTRLLHGPRTDVAGLRSRRPPAPAGEGQGEAWLYRKDGSEFFARWKYRALPGAAGPLVLVYHDGTELWRQREALLQSQKLGTVGLLAGGVAHDFNNLLSVINGYCEILDPKIAAVPAAHKDLKEIHRAGLKASAIARQILEFSRRQETETGVVNFNTLIREITEIIRRVCGEAIEVELRLASDLGNARINPVHFQQVLLNLCFNARDAMPAGGRLTLRTFNQLVATAAAWPGGPPPGSCVVLQVTDTGDGLEPGQAAKIFEPFYTTKPHGTGLGLPTAQGIIHQAQGHITVRSTPRAGTTFEVFLPETAEPEDTSPTALGVLPTAQGTEAILVIERDDGLRKMIAGILALDGYTATEAPTIDAADQPGLEPQLVILDTGAAPAAALLQKLHRANRELRVVCTAAHRPALPGFPDGQVAHLPKPFALSSLLTKVRAMLDARPK